MSENVKIVIFVPLPHADLVRKAIGNAGAGNVGNYDHCSFSSKGKGRFHPLAGANPFIGEVGQHEDVDEERIEMICPKDNVKKAIAAMKKSHPYEEVAYDIYPLMDEAEF